MTKMEREHRAHEWASRIEAFRASGMTQRRWAAEQGLSEDRVSYWYRKLGRPPESLDNMLVPAPFHRLWRGLH